MAIASETSHYVRNCKRKYLESRKCLIYYAGKILIRNEIYSIKLYVSLSCFIISYYFSDLLGRVFNRPSIRPTYIPNFATPFTEI
jgi:hypothetical protein